MVDKRTYEVGATIPPLSLEFSNSLGPYKIFEKYGIRVEVILSRN
jgi:hypothetical protein